MRLLPFLLVLPLALGCADAVSETASAPAGTGSSGPAPLKAALATANESGKNVLVIYGSKSCPYSRQMERETLSDAEVKAAMDKLVVLRLEKGVDAGEFEKKWGAQPTPTVVTLNADGKPLGKMVNGVVNQVDFLAYATWAKTGSGAQPGVISGGG